MISKNIYRATRKLIEPCCEYKYSEPNIAPYIKSDRIDRWMEWSGLLRAVGGGGRHTQSALIRKVNCRR